VAETKDITTGKIDGKIWLMNRVCPNCNKPIKDSNLFFCLSCGSKLDDALIRRDPSFNPKRTRFAPSEGKEGRKLPDLKNFHMNSKFLVGLFFVILAGAVSIAAIMLTMAKAKKTTPVAQLEQEKEVVETSNPNAKDIDLPQENINLADEDYTKYIPYGNYFYILGADAEDFYKRFFGTVGADSLLLGLDNFIEGKFILIGSYENGRWLMTSILYLKDEAAKDENFENVSKEGWYVKKVGDVLVLSEIEDMPSAVEEASKGISKNISHHPKFRTENTQIPKDGQLLFVNLSGQDDVLQQMISIYSPTQEVVESIKDIYTKKPTKFVIRNYRE